MRTKLTQQMYDGVKNPVRDMSNRKPYRTAAQKRLANEKATRGADTVFRASTVPVSYHPPVK